MLTLTMGNGSLFDSFSGLPEARIKINWDAERYSCPGAALANELYAPLCHFFARVVDLLFNFLLTVMCF